ncbi:putative n6-DNA-methyltransferase [Tripterygium wilfordii]|uniref:Putative n6-DNA-methyltransferase n=1 Tax=Tripterygium wilfordii TaxID=458696 RepID=A0A7J7CU41_TRIWF|nr:release factor glutamine methyltransferase [Tripterygium wilfordii]KAF5737645.1 putative n6-DNA-methyltransferase [Tripterygium wilfordii]
MKLSITRACQWHASPLCANLQRPICYSSPKLYTPLLLRPFNYSASLSDLQKWHNWAKSLLSSVGSTFSELDNGPDSSLLSRELRWLVQDAFEEPSLFPQMGFQNNRKHVKLRVDVDALYSLWKQRIVERRPFQYIVGCEHWRDLVLSVQEGVLIPRPETELIVDLVSELVRNDERFRGGLWADLGTGSGALAIGIGRILGQGGRVVATDISPVAVAVAGFNVKRYALEDVIEVKQGSWFEPLKDVEGKLVGIVSNPPYIPSEHIPGLQAEVGLHEPKLALDGGANGMGHLLHLCEGAASMLKPGGFFAFETNGEEQCKFLVEYIENCGQNTFCNVNIVSDFTGIQRFVTGFRQ